VDGSYRMMVLKLLRHCKEMSVRSLKKSSDDSETVEEVKFDEECCTIFPCKEARDVLFYLELYLACANTTEQVENGI
jgi:hypothetical protein